MSEAHTGTLGVSHVSPNALCNTHVTCIVTPLCINAFGASGFDKTLRLYAVFRQKIMQSCSSIITNSLSLNLNVSISIKSHLPSYVIASS